MKRVALHTLGCKLNYAETSTMGREFAERGFELVEFDQPADVYVLNTCSVTERADRECRQIVRRALRASPEAYMVVTGCYAQLRPGEIAGIEGVDLVLGTSERSSLFLRAGSFTKQPVPQVFVSCIDEALDCTPAHAADPGARTRSFLKVQDGCDYACAFCTIPLARGSSRSRPAEAIIRDARTIASHGFKEIVLTGVNVGDYGRKSGASLSGLLRMLDGIPGIERIRVTSIEPNLLTRELVDFMLGSGKCCNHFHVPLQSGSDGVLRRMSRRYTTHDYRRIVEYIKKKDADAGIGADVIVGFHGETDRHFEETASFIASLPLSYLHVFTFSERPGTRASAFDCRVEPRIRAERSEALRLLGHRKRNEFNSGFAGRTMPVLFEGRRHGDVVSGLTSNYIRVEAPSERDVTNELLAVAIHASGADACSGSIVPEEVVNRTPHPIESTTNEST